MAGHLPAVQLGIRRHPSRGICCGCCGQSEGRRYHRLKTKRRGASCSGHLGQPGARPCRRALVLCRWRTAWASLVHGGDVARTDDEPHASWRGWLKNGNPPGDFLKALRCGARTRRHTACRGPAMANGRCRMHGGKSTGPRTVAGLERSRRARWRHGVYSRETRATLAESRRRWRELRALLGRD